LPLGGLGTFCGVIYRPSSRPSRRSTTSSTPPVPRRAGPAELDLDAALTTETKTISQVDDTIPLVQQPERRVADA
jgi:hypothetical protein